jgi:AraC family transcriptional regulator of adaptative response/methylated-DNA-[protein]-cysteine methyltransferase
LNRDYASVMSKDDSRWLAITRRDKTADGQFVYSVKTTGVYCRPSCPSRRAKRENVKFHDAPADATREGYRPCKRCRPDEQSADAQHVRSVAKACRLIAGSDEALDLNALSDGVGMSPSHFGRVFKAQTGLTPKAYATAHRANRVRDALAHRGSVVSAIYNAGFNSTGRFYSNSSKVLGMKPTTFKAGGNGTTIRFAVGECSLGSILVAATEGGICAITLGDDPGKLVKLLQDRFPKAELVGGDKTFEKTVGQVIAFVEKPELGLNLPLEVRGTAFQQRVWQQLCKIPLGETRSYAQIAAGIGEPKATRAVAQACGANPVAVAIPCHRVVRLDGALSGYRWGIERKAKLLAAERSMK